jgi:2-dehydro-3-deoxyphosphogluconate aldolase / (4S)-4-hydroxy-2-oxoglutarate aldolase
MLRSGHDPSQDTTPIQRNENHGGRPVTWGAPHRVLAIVRYRAASDLDSVLDAARAGGIELREVTADTPGALGAVERQAARGRPIGLGTVVLPTQVEEASRAGAAFVVSPGVIPEVLKAARDRGLPTLVGALTPTEILTAVRLGADAVKLFPAALGGPAYLRTLRAPMPQVAFVPTGGIGPQEVAAYLEAGAACVGLGSSLVGSSPPDSDEDLAAIERRAEAAVRLAASAAASPQSVAADESA